MSDNVSSWNLKDSNGNTLTPDDFERIRGMLFGYLFPCQFTLDDLAMPLKKVLKQPPKRMNKFIVFRRALYLVLEQMRWSFDGKNLSIFASKLWKSVRPEEQSGYALIAEELKSRHNENYPDYVEKRKRKPRYQFVNCNESYNQTNCNVLPVNMESVPVNLPNITVPIGYGVMPDMYIIHDNICYQMPTMPAYDNFTLQMMNQQRQSNYDISKGDPSAGIPISLNASFPPQSYTSLLENDDDEFFQFVS